MITYVANMNSAELVSQNTQWPSYRYRAALKIAYHISRLHRGFQARREIQYYRWYRYNKAALIIQHRFKLWKNFKCQQIIDARIHRLQLFHPSMVRRTDTMKSFQKVVAGEGGYEDKMVIWRLALDLRRAHPSHSTDNCIKSILESKGDVNRALTLLGLPAFAARHFDDIPKKIKSIFMPLSLNENVLNESSLKKELFSYEKVYSHSIHSIRHIKSEKTGINRKRVKFSNIERDIAKSLEVVYFSKHHIGSKVVPSKYKKIYAPTLGDNYDI